MTTTLTRSQDELVRAVNLWADRRVAGLSGGKAAQARYRAFYVQQALTRPDVLQAALRVYRRLQQPG